MISLICYGNHAKDIDVIYRRSGGTGLLVHDDNSERGKSLADATGPIVIGINDSSERRRIDERLNLPGAMPIYDPSAIIGPNVALGPGVVIAPMAVLLHSVTLGRHVHVNYGASMTRCAVGDYTTIAPGAVICGNVVIGDECLIGASATICERTTIGNRVVVGASATIPPYSVVPDDTKVIGVWKG